MAEDPEEAKRKAAEGPVVDLVQLKKEDVIMHSLDARKATGDLKNTIPVEKSAPREIVFTLRQTGDKLKLTIQVIDPEIQKMNAAAGPQVDHAALKKDDAIMHSLDSRKAATGDVKNVVALSKDAPKEIIFKLR